MIIILLIAVLAIISVTVLLASHRKDKYQRIVRLFFCPKIMFGADPRSFGPWWSGDWFVGERVNEAITAGKARYAHKRGANRHLRRQQKHQRHHR